MYKENIVKFVSEQTVESSTVVNNEIKVVRRQGDVSKYFSENDYLTFDDSAETFCLKVTLTDNILKIAKDIDLKVYKNNKLLDLNKEPFKVVKEIVSAVAGFFVYGS